VAVVGAGYVGLVVATCLAGAGHDVVCVERDPARRAAVATGAAPFREPGLDQRLAKALADGRIRVAAAVAEAVSDATVVLLAVGTPARDEGGPDLSWLEEAFDDVVDAAPHGAVVAVKSTVPPGTSAALALRAAARGRRDIDVVANPEFLVEGDAVRSFEAPDRVVIGGTRAGMDTMEALYRTVVRAEVPVLRVAPAAAELAKLASNTFLAARVALINEVARLCDAVDASIDDVAAVLGADGRIGPRYLAAGPGFGGSCLPKDVSGLGFVQRSRGLGSDLVPAILTANARHRQWAPDTLAELLAEARPEGWEGAVVAVWGASFKAHTDDVRESAAVDLMRTICARGATVVAWDPVAGPAVDAVVDLAIRWVDDPLEAAEGADAVVLMTDWPLLTTLPASSVARRMRHRIVVDARNALDPSSYTAAGFRYAGVGRGRQGEPKEPA
jgi:UDPglucose 6-dehydrogenase